MQDDEDPRDRLGFLQFAGIYIASLALAMVVAFGGEAVTGISSLRILFMYFSITFLLGAAGWPWWWSATLRSLDWFSELPNAILTWLLAAIGALAGWAALGGVPLE